MTTLREAAQQALAALEGGGDSWRLIGPAITALRAALEQPEQEPVAWRNAALRVGEDLCSVGPFGYYNMTAKQWLDWALSVVTFHAPPRRETEQEPAAWMSPASASMIGKTDENGSAYHIITTSKKTANNSVPLFTHPPRREWRGLTEEEIDAVWEEAQVFNTHYDIARAIEAALKEKNHE